MNDWERRDKEDARDMAATLSRFVNAMGHKEDDLVEALQDTHRTLKQSVTRFCVKWLEQCAKDHDSGWYDLRNEASAELGKAFVETIPPEVRALPYI